MFRVISGISWAAPLSFLGHRGTISAFAVLAGIAVVSVILGCSSDDNMEVVIYTSLDQLYSEPIFTRFQEETGITVKAVYDTEAAKTTGLVNRLIAEKDNPQADIFWNNEIVRTIVLKRKGILSPYTSPSAAHIPDQFKDADGYWTGFAARARILICNTDLVPPDEQPTSIFDLVQESWRGQVTLANPLFGTTGTHVAALFVVLGADSAESYFRNLKANDVIMVAGNSTSRDYVRDGEAKLGFTDTDDANIAIENKKPVTMIFPDKNGIGTLLIPNSVALVNGARHQSAAKRLIDYILSEDVESALAHSPSAQIPLRPAVTRPASVVSLDTVTTMDVDFDKVADMLDESTTFVHDLFIR